MTTNSFYIITTTIFNSIPTINSTNQSTTILTNIPTTKSITTHNIFPANIPSINSTTLLKLSLQEFLQQMKKQYSLQFLLYLLKFKKIYLLKFLLRYQEKFKLFFPTISNMKSIAVKRNKPPVLSTEFMNFFT